MVDWGDGRPVTPAAPDWRDGHPAAPPATDGGEGRPAAPPAPDWRDDRQAAVPVPDWRDGHLVALPAVDGGDGRAAAPSAADWSDGCPAEPDWADAAPAAPPAGDSRRAATPPRANTVPAAAVPPEAPPAGRAGRKAEIEITERAAIGDELRIPLAWCEMGSCISHYADPEALGEADIRTRAIEAGWRLDALGRLACPQCQQGDAWFWTAHPVALWDRDTAVAMTTLMAAAVREIAGTDGAAGMERGGPLGGGTGAPPGMERAASPGGEPGAISGGEPGAIPGAIPGPRPEMARPTGRGRHRGHPGHADPAQ
jgi:hypothetical protein